MRKIIIKKQPTVDKIVSNIGTGKVIMFKN